MRLSITPSGISFGNRVEILDTIIDIGDDDCIINTLQGHLRPGALGQQSPFSVFIFGNVLHKDYFL